MGRSFEYSDDPLMAAIAPPPNEAPHERAQREAREAEARRISDEIDESLKTERIALRKKKRPVKVLLLGQSESGKSATLKNFQLHYARREWAAERDSWKSVIQLNLLRNVNSVLDSLTPYLPSSPTTRVSMSAESDDSSLNSYPSRLTPRSPASTTSHSTSNQPVLTEKHRLLQMRLLPLRSVQKDLERRLGAASEEVYTSATTLAAPFDSSSAYPGPQRSKRLPNEFFINSNNGWRSALHRFRPRASTSSGRETAHARRKLEAEADEITGCIAGCRDDMRAIWEDATVRRIVSRRSLVLEETPGFFLNDVARIATRDYQPTDNDIIRARLRTLGVQEHRFLFEQGSIAGQEWVMYDVGGTRSSRHVWYSYFDDVDAIIFLAPISCFDEKLAEDRKVNRLEDTYALWRSVLACPLLAKTQIVLFLNKCDLLQEKLRRGVRVRDYVTSFGERSNDLHTVTKYFQNHFREMSRQHSPEPRPFYAHLTSVIDTKSTATTLRLVEEGILRDHLRRADLL